MTVRIRSVSTICVARKGDEAADSRGLQAVMQILGWRLDVPRSAGMCSADSVSTTGKAGRE